MTSVRRSRPPQHTPQPSSQIDEHARPHAHTTSDESATAATTRKPSPSWAARVSYAAVIGAAIAVPVFRRDTSDTPKVNALSLMVSERVERPHTPSATSAVVNIDPQKVIDKIVAHATQSWSDDERAALTRLFDTLDQLAGGDHRFNHGDKEAISKAVLAGKTSIERVIGKRLVERKLNSALDELGVDPSTAERKDDVARTLTLDQLRAMPDDVETVKAAIARSQPENGDAIRERLQSLMPFRFGESPLRNGIPSPKSPEALLDTVIDALRALRRT